MISLLIAILFFGCYLFYNSSKKNDYSSNIELLNRLKNNKNASTIIAVSSFCISLFLSVFIYGFMAGFAFWLVILSILFSLIIIINPLQIVKSKYLIIIFFILLLIEFIL